MNALTTITNFFDILAKKSSGELTALTTDDVTFTGPFFTANGQQEFVNGMERWMQVPKVYNMRYQFVDGAHTCSIYTVTLTSPSGQQIPVEMADWIELRDGKIANERVYFDPREWATAIGR